MLIRRFLEYLTIFPLALLPIQGEAEQPNDHAQSRLSLPYGFYNEDFGFSAGWVEGRIGYPQPGSRLLGTAMIGSEGSAMGFLMASHTDRAQQGRRRFGQLWKRLDRKKRLKRFRAALAAAPGRG